MVLNTLDTIRVHVSKRFGHKDLSMGHASKLLHALANKTPPLNAASVANTPQGISSNKPSLEEVALKLAPSPPVVVNSQKASFTNTIVNLGAKIFRSVPTLQQIEF